MDGEIKFTELQLVRLRRWGILFALEYLLFVVGLLAIGFGMILFLSCEY